MGLLRSSAMEPGYAATGIGANRRSADAKVDRPDVMPALIAGACCLGALREVLEVDQQFEGSPALPRLRLELLVVGIDRVR